MNYIKRFKTAKDLSVSAGKSYSEDQLMHIFLYNFHQGGKYIAQIPSHQTEFRREEYSPTKKLYLLHLHRLIIKILTAVQVLIEIMRDLPCSEKMQFL